MKIDPAIQREIDASGLPFRFEEGKRHIKLMLGGEMVTVFSRKPNERGGRAVKNLVGHIRRKVRQVKQTDEPQPIPAPVVKLPEARAIPAITPQVPEKGETHVTTKTNSTPVDGILMSRAVSGVVVYLPNGSPVITELAPRPLRGYFDELGRFVVSPGSGGSTGFSRIGTTVRKRQDIGYVTASFASPYIPEYDMESLHGLAPVKAYLEDGSLVLDPPEYTFPPRTINRKSKAKTEKPVPEVVERQDEEKPASLNPTRDELVEAIRTVNAYKRGPYGSLVSFQITDNGTIRAAIAEVVE